MDEYHRESTRNEEKHLDPNDTQKAEDALKTVESAFPTSEDRIDPHPAEETPPEPPKAVPVVNEASSPPVPDVEPEHDPDETTKIETPAYLLKPIADMLPTIEPVLEVPVEPPLAGPKEPQAKKPAKKRPIKRADKAHKKPAKKKAKKTVAKRTSKKRKMKK